MKKLNLIILFIFIFNGIKGQHSPDSLLIGNTKTIKKEAYTKIITSDTVLIDIIITKYKNEVYYIEAFKKRFYWEYSFYILPEKTHDLTGELNISYYQRK